MPPTIYLTFAGLVVALLISLPLGILAALKRHSWVDSLCTAVAVAGQAMPLFWLGIMLIIVFSVRLRLLPASGYGTWQNFLMPAFCLGAALAPITMRLVRSGVIEVMNMEFIKTARAKGAGRADGRGQARVPQRLHPRDHGARACSSASSSAAPSSPRRCSRGPAWPRSPWSRSATRTSRWSSAR